MKCCINAVEKDVPVLRNLYNFKENYLIIFMPSPCCNLHLLPGLGDRCYVLRHHIGATSFPTIFVLTFLVYGGVWLLGFYRKAGKCESNVSSSDS